MTLTRDLKDPIGFKDFSELVLNYRDPRIEVSQPYGPDSNVKYFKAIPRSLPVLPNLTEAEIQAQEEADARAVELAKLAAAAFNAAMGVGIAVGMVAGQASLAILVKYFQIIDILTNTMGKMNVKLGPLSNRLALALA